MSPPGRAASSSRLSTRTAAGPASRTPSRPRDRQQCWPRPRKCHAGDAANGGLRPILTNRFVGPQTKDGIPSVRACPPLGTRSRPPDPGLHRSTGRGPTAAVTSTCSTPRRPAWVRSSPANPMQRPECAPAEIVSLVRSVVGLSWQSASSANYFCERPTMSDNYWIPCQHCGKDLPRNWDWWVCNCCGFRVCPACLGEHRGPHGQSFKCSQCMPGRWKSTGECDGVHQLGRGVDLGPFVLVFVYGFVSGVMEGMRSGSGCPAPAKEPSRERPSEWWIVGRKGERFRVGVTGDELEELTGNRFGKSVDLGSIRWAGAGPATGHLFH